MFDTLSHFDCLQALARTTARSWTTPTWTSSRRTPWWTMLFPPSSTTPSSYGPDSTWRSPQSPSILRSLEDCPTGNITTSLQVSTPDGSKFDVIFVGTSSGQLLKAVNSLAPKSIASTRTVIIEEIEVTLPSVSLCQDSQLLAGGGRAADKRSDSGSDGQRFRPCARHHCWPGEHFDNLDIFDWGAFGWFAFWWHKSWFLHKSWLSVNRFARFPSSAATRRDPVASASLFRWGPSYNISGRQNVKVEKKDEIRYSPMIEKQHLQSCPTLFLLHLDVILAVFFTFNHLEKYA